MSSWHMGIMQLHLIIPSPHFPPPGARIKNGHLPRTRSESETPISKLSYISTLMGNFCACLSLPSAIVFRDSSKLPTVSKVCPGYLLTHFQHLVSGETHILLHYLEASPPAPIFHPFRTIIASRAWESSLSSFGLFSFCHFSLSWIFRFGSFMDITWVSLIKEINLPPIFLVQKPVFSLPFIGKLLEIMTYSENLCFACYIYFPNNVG